MALNDDEDDEMEDEIQQVRVTAKRSDAHNVQPKVESLEFLDEAAQHIQQQPTKQATNITYMNMDSFTEKTTTVTNQQQQQQQQQSGTTRKTTIEDVQRTHF